MKFSAVMTFIFVFLLSSCAPEMTPANTPEKSPAMEEQPTRTYMIVTAILHDRAAFMAGYSKATGPLVSKYGGRYVMLAPGGKLLEGAWGDGASIVISEWPDRAAAEAFWNSPEYAQAKKLREDIADVQVMIIDAPKFTVDPS